MQTLISSGNTCIRRRDGGIHAMDERIPAYLQQRLLEYYGQEMAGRIEQGYRDERPVTLRVNTLTGTREEVCSVLQQAGIAWEPVSWYGDALILPDVSESEIAMLPVYQEGKVYLQNLSAMIPPLVMMPKAQEAILDMAAAPGGKTTQMAALSGGKAQITACERDARRAERLRYNLKLQRASALVMQKDARDLDDLFRFDKILLDAPCTGSGTIELRENVPGRRMTPEWVQKTVRTQEALIAKAIRLLKKGGELVYSTCSILPEENEEVVEYAMKGGSVELVPIDDTQMNQLPQLPVRIPGTLLICPDTHYEGFYIAKMRKIR